MLEVGIVGASGYVGSNLLKWLGNHPKAEVKTVTSGTYAGKKVSEIIEEVDCDLTFTRQNYNELNKLDVVFLAVPHETASGIAQSQKETKVIDMTADHRLSHTYGLPEVFKDEIKIAQLIGNPGCYATSVILSAYPVKDKIESAVFDCISGYSGAGKNAHEKFDYEDNMIAYKLTDHFHKKEMIHVLGIDLSFTPHVVNTFSGLMCTAHLTFKEPVSADEIKEAYKKYYSGTFTKVVDSIPTAKDVTNTPWCHIGGFEAEKDDRMVIISVIDNLLKGAATQAIENMNIMFGLDHKEGLVGDVK